MRDYVCAWVCMGAPCRSGNGYQGSRGKCISTRTHNTLVSLRVNLSQVVANGRSINVIVPQGLAPTNAYTCKLHAHTCLTHPTYAHAHAYPPFQGLSTGDYFQVDMSSGEAATPIAQVSQHAHMLSYIPFHVFIFHPHNGTNAAFLCTHGCV